MPNYLRANTPGATWFFTVNLLERHGNDLLVRDIDRLKACVLAEKTRRPFSILAWVVLPEHMHWIWRLPEGDADFPTRWRRIKTAFSLGLAKTDAGRKSGLHEENVASGNVATGSTRSGTRAAWNGIGITSISIR